MVSNTVDISSTDPWASYIGYYTVQDQSFGRLEEAVEAVSRLKHASALREEPTKTNNSGETASCSAFEFVCREPGESLIQHQKLHAHRIHNRK